MASALGANFGGVGGVAGLLAKAMSKRKKAPDEATATAAPADGTVPATTATGTGVGTAAGAAGALASQILGPGGTKKKLKRRPGIPSFAEALNAMGGGGGMGQLQVIRKPFGG